MTLRILRPRGRVVRNLEAAEPGVRWDEIQAGAHLPEVQALIRRAIAEGAIRVTPDPEGGVRILPIAAPRR